MRDEHVLMELDPRQADEVAGGVIIPPIPINPGIRIALWIARKLKR